MITKPLYNEMKAFSIYLAGEDGEDVLQSALLRAWRFKDSQNGNFKSWLKTIIKRENYRRFERKQFKYSDIDLDLIYGENSSITDKLTLNKCLGQLKGKQLSLINYRLQGYNSESCGKILGIKKNTVLVYWMRANDKMREYYKGA